MTRILLNGLNLAIKQTVRYAPTFLMPNASHQRQNGRVASILSDCMRLLEGIVFTLVIFTNFAIEPAFFYFSFDAHMASLCFIAN